MGQTNNTFGNLFSPTMLETAMMTTIESWLPTYLAEVERQQDIQPCTLARPRTYALSVEADLDPKDALPAIIVVSPGTSATPEREADDWTAWYQVSVVALVMAPAETNVRALCGYYAAAIRGAVLQHPSLNYPGGSVETTWWDGEEFQGEPGTDRNRTRGAVVVHFRCKVKDIVSFTGGPLNPDMENPCDPLPPLTTVQTVNVDVQSDDLDT